MLLVMDEFLPPVLKDILLGVFAVVLLLITSANSYPDVKWLQPFRLPGRLNEKQRARLRRTQHVTNGAHFILAGISLPFLYVISRVMFFHDLQTGAMILTGAASVVCIALGIWIIARAR